MTDNSLIYPDWLDEPFCVVRRGLAANPHG
jgi:hypothetical protein